jgi:hypothetical protein
MSSKVNCFACHCSFHSGAEIHLRSLLYRSADQPFCRPLQFCQRLVAWADSEPIPLIVLGNAGSSPAAIDNNLVTATILPNGKSVLDQGGATRPTAIGITQ